MTSETEKDPFAKKCPECFEKNKPGARVCKWCGYRYSEDELEQEAKGNITVGIITLVVGFILIGGFFGSMIYICS
jgi:hypothetical protein